MKNMLRYGLAILILFATQIHAQSRDWQALSQIKDGEKIKVSRKQGASVTGSFKAWTPEQVTIGSTTTPRSDVVKVERYRNAGLSRRKKALLGAGIGAGAGFGIGAALGGGCRPQEYGPCFARGETGAAGGGGGAIIGAIIGALLPHHGAEVIYAAR
jgi:hypothetical protein